MFLSSCQPAETATITIQGNSDEKQLLFFSDESNIHREANYYDALLELKKQFPREISNMKVVSSSEQKNIYKQYNISEYPSLLVVYKSEVLTLIEGNVSKKEILEPIIEELSKE